jgi:DNA-binding transcriptional regulator YhcF (GntR family)
MALEDRRSRMSEPLIVLDLSNLASPSEQIAAQIRVQITSGRIAPGTPLPSVRQLARDLDVAPNTIVRAYNDLEQGGWVIPSARKGVSVAPSPPTLTQEEQRASYERALAHLLVLASQLGMTAADLHKDIDRHIPIMAEPFVHRAAK